MNDKWLVTCAVRAIGTVHWELITTAFQGTAVDFMLRAATYANAEQCALISMHPVSEEQWQVAKDQIG